VKRLVPVVFLLPTSALACPVCGGTSAVDPMALLVMTIIMSLLPLAMIGGVVWWIRSVHAGNP
jgi:hypothetical protein